VHYSTAEGRLWRGGDPQCGGKAAAFKADFGSVDQVQALARQAIGFSAGPAAKPTAAWLRGGLDVLVNNAALHDMPFLSRSRP